MNDSGKSSATRCAPLAGSPRCAAGSKGTSSKTAPLSPLLR
jgi:hypothetical protein